MIREVSGNLLEAPVDALVNTVNTVGVMGKGIALQFRRAYPAMFDEYERAAQAGQIRPGKVQIWYTNAMQGPRFVINFPTKRHWRSPSRLDDISAGLDDLARVVRDLGIESIAVPPLGAGNGGLEWRAVWPLIEQKLSGLGIDVLVYPPKGTPEASAMPDRRPRPAMTPGRAALLAIMRAYLASTWDAPSLVEIQKLMYFLQVTGEPLRLRYVPGQYGPYADNLRHVLVQLEGHYILGFGDGSAKVREAEPLRLLTHELPEVDAELARHPDTKDRIARVLDLVKGFESPYGLELLASVHWAGSTDPATRADPTQAALAVRAWTDRRRRLFTPDHVAKAWQALDDHDWLAPAA